MGQLGPQSQLVTEGLCFYQSVGTIPAQPWPLTQLLPWAWPPLLTPGVSGLAPLMGAAPQYWKCSPAAWLPCAEPLEGRDVCHSYVLGYC